MNFDEWWNEDYDDSENPFEKDSFGYWAFAGWCAQQQQQCSEPVCEWVGIADKEIEDMANDFEEGYIFLYRSFAAAIEAKLKERNT